MCVYLHTYTYTQHAHIVYVYVCIYVYVGKHMRGGLKRCFTNSAASHHHVDPPWFSMGDLWRA